MCKATEKTVPPRLLTEEEYRLQGEVETRKALEQLREYCNSPDCSAWKTVSRIPPVLLPGKSRGQRSLVGCSPWGREESDTTEQLHLHFSFSCIGEGNGNPVQCSCLENPRDRGAWWAAVYGVTESQTRLKQRNSSSSSIYQNRNPFQW